MPKEASGKGQMPPQKLKVSLRSGLKLLIFSKFKNFLWFDKIFFLLLNIFKFSSSSAFNIIIKSILAGIRQGMLKVLNFTIKSCITMFIINELKAETILNPSVASGGTFSIPYFCLSIQYSRPPCCQFSWQPGRQLIADE